MSASDPSGRNRSVAISTPLEEDKLVIASLEGTEQLGELFHFDVSLLSRDHGVDGDALLGENVTVRLMDENGEPRYFNGFVSAFSQHPSDDEFAYYQLELRPWLWFLTQAADCRIFQEKTVPEIIMDVLRGRGFDDIEDRLTETYRQWEYCVQYRETDFNFVSRLMEQEGIYYYFLHENGKHTLVLADDPSAHEPITGYERINFAVPEDAERESEDHIWHWKLSRQVRSGRFDATSFDFKSPRKNLSASSTRPDAWSFAQADLPVFDYLGDYTESSDGDRYAKVRMQEIAQSYELAHGIGDARGMYCGGKFELTGYPRDDQNREYLVLSVHHRIKAEDYRTGGVSGSAFYENSVSVMSADTPYRSPQVTPKPEIRGPQTALVTGASGEEIHTDAHGRIKVKFHWDRYASADDSSSCWIRVSQVLAGNMYGGMVLPRVGQEVIVEHLEGDPDRPIITGRVYNGDNTPPYELPAEKTKSTLKSNSSKGGGGFNEIRFEDKKGEEQLFIHAELDQDVRVKRDRFETILRNRHLLVEKDKLEHVKNNRNETVDMDHIEHIGKDRHVTVEGAEALLVSQDRSVSVDGDMAHEIGGDASHTTGGDYFIQGANIVIEGQTNITLKVGSSVIAISAAGIKIEGTMLEAKASSMGTVDGGGTLVLKGGMVTIN